MSLNGTARTWVANRRARLRDVRNRLVDQQLRQLEALRRRLLQGVDVLLLGDSSCLYGAPGDVDGAMIPELVSRELDGARVATFAGPGYSARMYAEALRILGTLDQRPAAVVSSVCVRTSTTVHVTEHPVYRYDHSLAAMARITSARHRIPSLGRGHAAEPRDYQVFRALPVRTRWSGETTIGAFRARLEGMGRPPWPPEVESLLFDYFHGEEVTPDNPGLERWREFGRQVRAYGVPAVSYVTSIPIDRGERHYPGEFAALARTNRALVDAAIAETAGDSWRIVDGGLADDDFADCRDATEHFALSGRLKIAGAVAAALGA